MYSIKNRTYCFSKAYIIGRNNLHKCHMLSGSFFITFFYPQYIGFRTSLVAQWVRICLPMQGTQVWSLIHEDSHHPGATKPMGRNCWAHALEPACCTCLEPVLHMREDTAMRSLCTKTESSPHTPQLEKACMKQRRPSAAIKKTKHTSQGFPGSSVVKNPPANAGVSSSIPGSGRSEDLLEKEMATHPVFLPG